MITIYYFHLHPLQVIFILCKSRIARLAVSQDDNSKFMLERVEYHFVSIRSLMPIAVEFPILSSIKDPV